MNHDDDCNVTPNWGPKIGGSRDSYRLIREANPSNGDRIRIHIPGLAPIETTISMGPTLGAVTVNIFGTTYYVGDRTNGGNRNNNWQVQFEVKTKTRVDAVRELPTGTMFFITPDSASASRSVYLRTAQGVTNVTQGRDLVIDADNFGHAPANEGFPYIIGRLETAS
jgi:hypothetical protein